MTHTERMARLRRDVKAECARRWSKLTGCALTPEGDVPEDSLIWYDLAGERELYLESRAIESDARRRWAALKRAVKGCRKFATTYVTGTGAHVAEAILASASPLEKILNSPYEVMASGVAAFGTRPPGRAAFLRDKLHVFAHGQGVSDPRELDVKVLAVMTLLATDDFWPYSRAAERRFAKAGYPTAATVIAKEAEHLRSLLKRPAP